MRAVEIYSTSTDPVFLVLFAICIGYTILFWNDGKSILLIMRGSLDVNLSHQLFREDHRRTNRTLIIMVALAMAPIGMHMAWAYYCFGALDVFTKKLLILGILVAAFAVAFRYTTLQSIAFVTMKHVLIDKVLFSFWILLASIGPIVVLLLALSVYAPPSIRQVFTWLGLIIPVFGYMMFLFRGAVLSLQEPGVGPLQLFYYLCALEIMPFLVAYRVLLS